MPAKTEREPTIGARANKRGTALSPDNLALKPTSGDTEVNARTSIATTAGEIGTVDPGMARLAGKKTGSGPGNTGVAIVAGAVEATTATRTTAEETGPRAGAVRRDCDYVPRGSRVLVHGSAVHLPRL